MMTVELEVEVVGAETGALKAGKHSLELLLNLE